MPQDQHKALYGKAVAFFRGTQMGDPARARRWRAVLWVASATNETCYAALEALRCEPDQFAPGALYDALAAPDRLLLDAAASLLQNGSTVSLAALAGDLDDERLALVLDGICLLHGSALPPHLAALGGSA